MDPMGLLGMRRANSLTTRYAIPCYIPDSVTLANGNRNHAPVTPPSSMQVSSSAGTEASIQEKERLSIFCAGHSSYVFVVATYVRVEIHDAEQDANAHRRN